MIPPRLRTPLRLLLAGLCLGDLGCSGPHPRELNAANQAIEKVDAAGRSLAFAVQRLPRRDLNPDDVTEVRDLVAGYLRDAERVNAALRALGQAAPDLSPHLDSTFRPAAELAAIQCQESIDLLSGAASSSDDLARGIARCAACVEKYSAAVSSFSAEVGRWMH